MTANDVIADHLDLTAEDVRELLRLAA